MTAVPLVLVDPPRGPFWPLMATRSPADLLAGTRTFRERWAARAGAEPFGVAAGEPGGAGSWPDPSAGLRVALSTWVPPPGWTFGDAPFEHRAGETPVAWRLDAAAATSLADAAAEDPAALGARLAALGLPAGPAGGHYVDSAWALMAANPDLIVQDAADAPGEATVTAVDPGVLLGRAADVRASAGVALGPFVVLDARSGPIVLGRDVRVGPHTVLRGPLYVGPDSALLGGEVGGGTSIGPRCKVRGEVEQAVFQGYSNKAHEGFVGHSVIGAWSNLGAGTTTSDLKNSYGPVRVEGPDGRVDTGLLKVGAFLGDHVRTGIGTLLTTGAMIGAGSHLFGGRAVSPAWLPDFSWHDGRERTVVRWDPFERSLRAAMARRERAPDAAELAALRALHARSGG